MGMVLENSSANKKIARELNSKYGDIIIAEAIDAALGTYEDTFELGAVAGALFSDDVLNIVFGLFGISKVVSDNTVFTFATAIGLICICGFIFAYVVSGKNKES